MHRSPPFSSFRMDIHQTIASVISKSPSPAAVKLLVELFHRLAIVYLRKKAGTGSLKPDLFGIPLEDVAFDCIADLFNRNQDGVFVELQKYYAGVNWSALDDDQLLGVSRRLVFSKVTQDLYRQYHELDPTLHRIIRNVKDAAMSMSEICAERRNEEWWICFSRKKEDAPLPVMPVEILEAHVSSVVSDGLNTRQILTAVSEILATQSIYQSSYPLFGLALGLRSTFARLGEIPSEVVEDHHGLAVEEIGKRIEESVSTVSQSMKRTYVEKGKVDETTYQSYFRAVEGILRTEFVEENHEDGSYFGHLSMQLDNLTLESYRAGHRAYLEYLTKVTRKRFLDEMRKEL